MGNLKQQPGIFYISGDPEDQFAINEVVIKLQLKASFLFFADENEALDFASSNAPPLLFIYDLDLPRSNGIAFVQKTDERFGSNLIPIVFVVSTAKRDLLRLLYSEFRPQGIFEKPLQIEQLKIMLTVVVQYWLLCKNPSGFKR